MKVEVRPVGMLALPLQFRAETMQEVLEQVNYLYGVQGTIVMKPSYHASPVIEVDEELYFTVFKVRDYILRPAIGNRTCQFEDQYFNQNFDLHKAREVARMIHSLRHVAIKGWENEISFEDFPHVSIIRVDDWRIVEEV